MLLLAATMLAGNVVAARVAMDNGTALATLVAVRSALAALVANWLVLDQQISALQMLGPALVVSEPEEFLIVPERRVERA